MEITNPHDKFFRETFCQREAASDFLRYYLPPELSQLFDLDTLEISKDSFVDTHLQEHFSDVLYQLTLVTQQKIDVYVLFEHKSYPDKQVAYQILRYMVRIWEQEDKQQKTLRPILPLLVYHGEKKWHVDLELHGLFGKELPQTLRPYLPNFRYWLLDLSGYPDEDIKGWVILQAHLRLLKYIWSRDFGAHFAQAIRLLFELPNQQTALEYLYTMLRYAVTAAEHVSEEELNQLVVELFEQGEVMPTIAQRWLEQGEQLGLAKGEQLGLVKGEQLGLVKGERKAKQIALKNIRQTLAIRFGVALELYDARLEKLDLTSLELLNDLAFSATSLAEFEAKLPPNELEVK